MKPTLNQKVWLDVLYLMCVLKLILVSLVYDLGVAICQSQRYFIVRSSSSPTQLSTHSGLSTFNLCFSCWYVNSNAAYIKLFALSHLEMLLLWVHSILLAAIKHCKVYEKEKRCGSPVKDRLACWRISHCCQSARLRTASWGLADVTDNSSEWKGCCNSCSTEKRTEWATILLLKRFIILKEYSKTLLEEAGLCKRTFWVSWGVLEKTKNVSVSFLPTSFHSLFPNPWMHCVWVVLQHVIDLNDHKSVITCMALLKQCTIIAHRSYWGDSPVASNWGEKLRSSGKCFWPVPVTAATHRRKKNQWVALPQHRKWVAWLIFFYCDFRS